MIDSGLNKWTLMLIAPGMLRESEAASPSTHNSGTSEAYFDLAIKYVRRWHHVVSTAP